MAEARAPQSTPVHGLIAVPAHQWGNKWMVAHHVLTSLARHYHVAWVDPPIHWRRAAERPGVVRTNGITVHPAPLHVHRLPALSHWLLRRRLNEAARDLREQGADQIGLYLWHPRFAAALDWSGADATFYHVEDEYSFSDDPVPIPPEELRILEGVDHVFLHSPTLYDRKGAFARSASRFPNGVDYDAIVHPGSEPEDLRDIPRPRIGYTGWVKKQIDWALVARLAEARPSFSFVIVGGRSPHPSIQADLEKLESLPNCFFLGAKPTSDLVRYPAFFDVSIMPYHVTWYTRHIYPLKLHEYLAAGSAVVSSPIPAVEEHADVVALADGVDQWLSALDTHTQERDGGAARQLRRQRAAEHDWDALVDRAILIMRKHLG